VTEKIGSLNEKYMCIIGTMAHHIPNTEFIRYQGSLYSVDADHTVKKHVDKIDISNGLAWSLDNSVLYYVDSWPRKVYAFDFDLFSGSLCKCDVLFRHFHCFVHACNSLMIII